MNWIPDIFKVLLSWLGYDRSSNNGSNVTGYVDFNFAGYIDKRMSLLGYIFTLLITATRL